MTYTSALTPVVSVLDALAGKIAKEHGITGRISLVVGSQGISRGGQTYGHFAAKSWTDPDGADIHEIMIAVDRGAVATVGTLIHEFAHLYCFENDQKDTSDGNRYHNKVFKDQAESMGLTIEKANRIGWSVTTVPNETQEKYADEISALDKAINAWRRSPGEIPGPISPPSKKYLMACPECHDSVPIGKKWFDRNQHLLECTEHNERFELEGVFS